MNKQTKKHSPEEDLAKVNYTQVVQGVQFRLRAIMAAAQKINTAVQHSHECDQSKQIIQSVSSDLDHVLVQLEEIKHYLSMRKVVCLHDPHHVLSKCLYSLINLY